MAKPRPVQGIDPSRRMRPNARRILATRIDEAWSYSEDVTHPGRVRELHDMRIAFKRLRYLIEIFGLAFSTDLGPYLAEIKEMQDVLGDIHDRDVQIPMLHEHLDRLTQRDAERARELILTTRPEDETSPDDAYARFSSQWSDAASSAERPGILALLERRMGERDHLYQTFLGRWRSWSESDFRGRLEAAIGVRPDR